MRAALYVVIDVVEDPTTDLRALFDAIHDQRGTLEVAGFSFDCDVSVGALRTGYRMDGDEA